MSAFEQAVLNDLEFRGWRIGKPHQGRDGTMYRANDGAGSSDAQTILIKDSIAVVTSHRGGVDLPAPWRAGREAKDGSPTAYITARDLGIDLSTIRHAPSRALVPPPAVEPVDPTCVSGVRAAWDAKVFPRDDHPQFVKGGAWVHPGGLREFPPGHRHAGDLIAPLFRRVAPGSLSIELCGAQQLLRDTTATPDKYIVSGSRTAGAFVPLPLRQSFFEAGAKIGADWLPSGTRIVVTEGVRTGQAVRTATAQWAAAGSKETVVLAALSAHNLPALARWLKASGVAASHEVVIAADNDLRKSDFVGIKKAVEAAEICGGKVALVDSNKPGFDAHDLLIERKHDLRAGMAAVREFIDAARSPDQVRADRVDAFDLLQKNRGEEIEHYAELNR
jgi:hypothetical protein